MKNAKTILRALLVCLLILAVVALASCGNTEPTNNHQSSGNSSQNSGSSQNNNGGGNTAPKTVTIGCYQDGKLISDTQTVESGTRITEPAITMEDDDAYRYTVLGWDANGDGIADSFPYTVTQNTEFHLVYEKIAKMYTVEIYDRSTLLSSETLPHGADIHYPEISSSIEPDGNVFLFQGWAYDGVFDGLTYLNVTKNVRIDAHYADTQILKLTFLGNIHAEIKKAGDSLDFAGDFKISPSDGKVIRYYTDDTYLTPYTGTFMPNGNLTLYAREESKSASVPTIHVNSREEMLSVFGEKLLNREPAMEFSIDYNETDDASLLNYLQDGSVSYTGYSVNSSLSYGIYSLTLTYPEVATTTSGAPAYTQVKSLNVKEFSSDRGALYDDFPADKRSVAFPVKNSDALFYALEHGYRPDIDGDATDVIALYNTMKIFLRTSVTNSMTDFEKVRTIYEKLILETVYDNAVLQMVEAEETDLTKYRAFALEGVFIDHLAVCDGISKAFASLCAMEGIECVRVSGNIAGGGCAHAWNKVKLNGNWYVVDATAGGTIVNTNELLTYGYFLISDATYAEHAEEDGIYYADIHAIADYGFYNTATVTLGGTAYSLLINDATTGGALLQAIAGALPAEARTLDIRLGFGASTADAVQAMLDAAAIPGFSLNFASSLGNSVILVFHA